VILKYKAAGIEMPQLSKALDVFLHAYADEDGVPGCYEECASICKVEGVRELLDLRMLAKRTFLGDYFPAKVALRFENAFESPKVEKAINLLENQMANGSTRAHKPWTNTFHLKMTLEAVENVCGTYGILSALMLTMNVSAFGSMSVEEWELFERGLAVERCESPGNGNEVNLGYNTTQECVEYISHASEVWFVSINLLASMLLLFTVLFSSWLYIAVSVPAADRTRPDEVQAVVARFSGEFLALNIMFCLSVAGSVAGLQQLVQLKMRSWGIFKVVSLLSAIVGALIVLSAIWILIEVGQARRNVKALRQENARADDDFNSSDQYLDNYPDQKKEFENLVSRAKVDDQEVATKTSRPSRRLSSKSGPTKVSPN